MAGTKKRQRKGKGATGISQDADIQPASGQNVHSGTHQAVLQDNDDDGNEDNPFSFKPTGLDNTSALAQPTSVLCQPGSCSHSQGHANVHFANKSPGEEFEWDNTSNDSADESNVLATPTPCAHTRNNNDKTPQAFRHAPLSQPQPNIQRLPACSSRLYSYTAENCWNWQETEMEYICNICLELKSKSEFPETFKVQTYKLSSGITNMHNHLMLPTHLPIWIAHCDHLGIPIKALLIIKKVEAYQNEHGVEVPAVLATQVFSKFSIEGLTQLLMEVIITEDLPITFVESEQTMMMKVIIKTWHQKMYELAAEMKLTLSKISFTCDGWTDLNLFPFIAITAHWIKEVVISEKTKCGIQMQTLLEFHSDVIAFHEVLVSHWCPFEGSILVFGKSVGTSEEDTTLVSDKKDGLVKYWEANHEKYPTIFALAVDLLLIQGTSVPCNELMEATQILKNSIKHNSPLNFTEHYNQSNEMTELEEIIHQDEDHIPDTVDVETFRGNLPTVSFVQ
ncbi:hypothetical protein Moror_4831 [Moniliophthora roreri MCA 2997]|uniref:HAT C-terminal dimerisation domain-containing protein n=1 Tax=Moniliophthora roreri (strain MCA 2997) TaxID=1381753 RepID=V2XI65_MONRO|nr:hypothetical protein Moror_4831 [Moniliophthora roreri MCA 2997]